MNGFALGLGLKRRLRATRKWAIVHIILEGFWSVVKPKPK